MFRNNRKQYLKNNWCLYNIKKMFERELLYLPCRHHFFEIALKSIFAAIMGSTSGPDVNIFKRFKESWSTLYSTKYRGGVNLVTKDARGNMIEFLEDQLRLKQHRDDYLELLELAVIFLGGSPRREILFRIPGSLSKAQWMAKTI